MSGSGQNPSSTVLRMELGCDFAQIRPAADKVQGFLREHGCSEQARQDCELALVEACNNAIKHSSNQGAPDSVVVEVQVEPDEIEVRVTDHGPGFAWPETARLPAPDEESGRGLYLIRALTDYSAYVRRATENILVLRKKRSGA